MRKIFFILLYLGVALSVFPEEPVNDANTKAEMEQIRTNPAYRYGEAYEVSFNDARDKARKDLFSKLKTTLVSKQVLEDDEFSSSTTAITVGAIENLKEIYVADKKGYNVIAYVSEQDLKEAEQDRKDIIADFIEMGKKQEGLMNISEALKYYTWAYRLLNLFGDKVRINTVDGERNAQTWLSNHIPAMLSNIAINIPEEKISEDESQYDRYMVTVEATYDGRPVSTLDIIYNNGEKMVPVHCKSGEGVLTFHDLSTVNNITVRVQYDFPEEGRNANSSLKAAYAKGFKPFENFNKAASMLVPLKIKKDRTQKTASKPEFTGHTATAADLAAAADAKPVITVPKKTMTRPVEDDAAKYQVMTKVEQAIRAKNYSSVEPEFTPDGFKIFEQMMGSGTVSVSKKNITYTVERSGNFIVGKSIPVAVKNGSHISKENIVFRFDPTSGKIASVAYALTKLAEDDIFREGASWTLDSRYALVQFMEDYQTAFALKRFDYISSIFSDDAIIIVGKFDNRKQKRFYQQGELKGTSLGNRLSYVKYNKETYLSKVKEDFAKKSFIQLAFEETKVEKVDDKGFANNDVIWIELKQKYNSSNYRDEGYLALQINLKPTGSMINVRTWTPEFVKISELKKAFPIGGM